MDTTRDGFTRFAASMADAAPPAGSPDPLAALWWDRKGDWDAAHRLVAPLEGSASAAWVHGYLHRKEGDAGNARYWYARAGKPVPTSSLDEEWQAIASALAGAGGPAPR